MSEITLREEEQYKAKAAKRKNALGVITDQFQLGRTVSHLQNMMEEVTKKEINADTVNAACNCVQNLNLTIKTVINAAKFISDE